MSVQAAILAQKQYQDFIPGEFSPRGSLAVIWNEWSKLAQEAGNIIPSKKSISMRRFKSVLPDLLIAERTATDEITVRLSGTRIDEMRGFVLSGKNLLEVVLPHLKSRINRVYNYVSDHPCGFYISEDIILVSGKTMELDIIVLPLTDQYGVCKYFLSGYHFSNRHLFNPFEDSEIQMKPRKINRLGLIDLGYGLPTRQS